MGWPLAAIAALHKRDRSTIWREVQRIAITGSDTRDTTPRVSRCRGEASPGGIGPSRRTTGPACGSASSRSGARNKSASASRRSGSCESAIPPSTTICTGSDDHPTRYGHTCARVIGNAAGEPAVRGPPSIRGPSIRRRPRRIDRRTQIGHWEIDTVFGDDREQALVTAVERVTGRVAIGKRTAVTAEQLTPV